MDWDTIRFRIRDDSHWLPRYRTVRLANPLGHTKAVARRLFPESGRLEDVLDALDAREEQRPSYGVTTIRRDEPDEEPSARARSTRED